MQNQMSVIRMRCYVYACAFLTATIADPVVRYSCVISNIHQSDQLRLAAPVLLNKNSTGG